MAKKNTGKTRKSTRLQTPESFEILDASPEKDFDDLTRLAANICRAPISLLTLADDKHLFFKSRFGLNIDEMPNASAFCPESNAQSNDVLVIEDAREDARFKKKSPSEENPGFVFYAGAPLITPAGGVIGSLCVIDRKPRKIEPEQLISLKALANQAMLLLELRQTRSEAQKRFSIEKRFRALVENGADAIIIVDVDGKTKYVSPSITRVLGYTEEEALKLNLFEVAHPEDLAGIAKKMAEVMQTRGIPIKGHTSRIRHKDGSWRWLEATVTNMLHDPSINGIVDNFRDITLRIEAENELRISEKKYRTLFNSSPLPMWIYDPETFRIVDVNQTAQMHYGYSREEFLNLTLKDLRSAEDIPQLISAHAGLESQEGNIRFGTFTHKKKNGELIKMEISGHKMDFQDRTCMMVVCVDVSEKVLKREIELLERELLEQSIKQDSDLELHLTVYLKGIEKLFPTMKTSVLKIEEGRTRNFISPTLSRTFADGFNGLEIGEQAGSCGTAAFLRKTVIVSDIARDPLWKKYKKAALQEGLKACWSQPIFDSKGKVIATFANYYPVIKEPTEKELKIFARAASLLGVIMESLRKSNALILSNERYEKITQATSDAVWDWDIVNDTLYWGVGFKLSFGYDVEKNSPTLQSWSDQIHPEDSKEVLDTFYQVLENPDSGNFVKEYRFLKADGYYAFVIDRGVVIRNQEGKAIRMVGAMTDITHRKSYEESLKKLNENLNQKTVELEISNKELEQFAYVASHDLQEPLRMVTSFLTKIEDRYEPLLDDRGKKYIELAVDGATRMRRLILDLLEYSRSARNTLEFEEVDLNDIIAEVTTLHRKAIEDKRAAVLYKNLPVIRAAESPVLQLFNNLIGNSLKYSKANVPPVIEIGFTETPTHWKFSVKDNGIGILPEFHDKLFILFQRLHHKNEYSGTGIGLAMCKKIVQRLGGEIAIVSNGIDGTVFNFTIKKKLI